MHHWPKVAIIVGGADCVWEDYRQTKALIREYNGKIWEACGRPDTICVAFETFVINDTISIFPDYIDHAVSLHPNKFHEAAKDGSGNWAHKRNKLGGNIPPKVWGHRGTELTTNTTGDWGGSSGLFACKIALELGFHRIIMCGVPLDPLQNHIERHKPWPSAKNFQRGWITRMKTVQGKVKSWNGWTKDQLGLPTLEWLSEP